MRTHEQGWIVAAVILPLALSCDATQQEWYEAPQAAAIEQALDNMYEPPGGMSLLLLDDSADLQTVVDAVNSTGGKTLHVLPPRLLVAKVAAGSDPILEQSGLLERFERAVSAEEIPRATWGEARFARVFGNRYYRDQIPDKEALRLSHQVVPEGEQWEVSPSTEAADIAEDKWTQAAATRSIEDDISAESWVYVPYASGTVVISVWLPESNGAAEPSTEDWTEDEIAAVYEKIQTAVESFTRHEPNSGLKFIFHYESAPAERGLPGTIDHDWEFGKQAQYGSGNEPRSVAALLSKVLQRDVDTGNMWEASHDYINALRDLYNADAAFYVMVAANSNYTASLRAHAYLYGPSTTLHSRNDWSVFMHEFGHIFGAGDEYCPDACWSPTSTHGYLGAINANATYRVGGPGINDGRGESQPSLMTYNAVNALNGYTRSAFGWLDSDGDGIVEVRDTFPRSQLEAAQMRDGLHLQGLVSDIPASPLGRTPFSENRIAKLEYRFADLEGSPWFTLPVLGTTRGREFIDVALGDLPVGTHRLEVRAVNSVGNKEPQPKLVTAVGRASNTAPHLKLTSPLAVGGTDTRFPIEVMFLDLEDDAVSVSLDLDANGTLETIITDPAQLARLTTTTLPAGRRTIHALATDANGNSRSAELELMVLDGNAPPTVSVRTPTNQVNGSAEAPVRLQVADLLDPEGQQVLFNWISEVAGDPYSPQRWESGFADEASLNTVLTTPLRLVINPLELSGHGEFNIILDWIQDMVLIEPEVVALALGKRGVAIFDISDRKSPQLLSHIELETSAYDLSLEGDRLLVLGGQLAVVDISDLRAPDELTQWWPTFNTVSTRADDPVDIWSSGWSASQWHWAEADEKIADLAIKVVVDHPDASNLTIVLESDKEVGVGAITLMDRNPNAQGRSTFVFNTMNTPELRQVIGAFSGGNWNVMVFDQGVLSGDPVVVGRLVSSRLRFNTEHRAIPVIQGARRILGAVDEDYVVVAGNGIQVIDVFWPSWAMEVAQLTAPPIAGAALVGHRVIGGTQPVKPLEGTKSGESHPWSAKPDMAGLFAVDLRFPFFPWITRQEPAQVEALVVVGSRLYATLYFPDEPRETSRTMVGDLSAFFRGRAFELGRTSHMVLDGAHGDDTALWTRDNGGRLVHLDVSNPNQVSLIETLDEPFTRQVLWLSPDEILANNYNDVFTADLNERTSLLSRVYQLTLEAKDSGGTVSQAVRNLHVVPYAHAPSICGIEVLSGNDDRDTWELLVTLDDPDQGASWDPYSMARVDFDNDGVLETPWYQGWETNEIHIWHQFPTPGTYNLLFEARDGFYGRSEPVAFTVEVPPWAEQPCGGAHGDTCDKDEFCFKGLENACDDTTEGVCRLLWQPCPKEELEEGVCGCNGLDYDRACDAWYDGVNVAFSGRCPVMVCASNDDCPSRDQFCLFETNEDDPSLSCGASGPGTCEPRPTRCPLLEGEPDAMIRAVCGCDGRLYYNFCSAHQSGQSIFHSGPCEDPPLD